jgi:RNA recognition motif-containing protein
MPVKLFVGGLSFSTASEGLRAAFARFGLVNSATVMTDRETGRSRGFGFVEMATAEEADKAISSLNGSSLDGRMIRVDKATPRGAGGPAPRGPFRPGGGAPGGGYRGSGPGGASGGGYGGAPRPGGFGDRRPGGGSPPADAGRGGFGAGDPLSGRGDGPPRPRRAAGGPPRGGSDQRPGPGGPKRGKVRKPGSDQSGGRGRRTSDGDFRWGR